MVVVEVARGGRVDVDDVYVVGIRVLEPVGEGAVREPVLAVQLERHECGGNRGGIGGADHAAGGFADAEFGGEEAGDVEAELGVAAGVGGGIRRVAAGEIEDHFAGIGRDGADAELAVLVLGAEALPGAEAGDAAEPREEIGDADAVEPEGDPGGGEPI